MSEVYTILRLSRLTQSESIALDARPFVLVISSLTEHRILIRDVSVYETRDGTAYLPYTNQFGVFTLAN